jgi:phosphate transport system protein
VDLRFVAAVMKINNDLERMGDSAVNIAQAVQILNNDPPLKSHVGLPRLSKLFRQMVRESLDSFVQGNTELALEIFGRDDQAEGSTRRSSGSCCTS